MSDDRHEQRPREVEPVSPAESRTPSPHAQPPSLTRRVVYRQSVTLAVTPARIALVAGGLGLLFVLLAVLVYLRVL